MYINESLRIYIDDLAARKPAPGGGSAAALTGALGVSLLEMTANFTIGNKKYKDVEEITMSHLGGLKKIREEFMVLIDEDVKAYSSICEAFKTKDKKIIDNALKEGYYISLKMCRLAISGMKISLGLADKSNANLITDVGCGSELLRASFNSGSFNSEINLKGIKEDAFVEKENTVLRALKKEITDLYEKTISKVTERMAQ